MNKSSAEKKKGFYGGSSMRNVNRLVHPGSIVERTLTATSIRRPPIYNDHFLIPSYFNVSTTGISPQWQRPLKLVPAAKTSSRQWLVHQRLTVYTKLIFFYCKRSYLIRRACLLSLFKFRLIRAYVCRNTVEPLHNGVLGDRKVAAVERWL